MLRPISLLISALLAACASSGEANAPIKPGLWKVADEDTTIYLFGTIHMLPPDYDWRTKAFDKALGKADQLVLEVVLDKDPKKTAEIVTRLGRSPGLPPLLERVPADKREALARLIETSKIPMDKLDGMETWSAATTLATLALRKANITAAEGVERQLSASFEGAGKPIGGLETTEQQLGYFDTLPETVQRQFLVSVIESNSDADAEFRKMMTAWSSGDTNRIATTFDEELKLIPELGDVLLRQRNANWTDWVKKRLDQPGTVFVAVGAGHLAGKDSVQAMLSKQGVKVTRVQ
ncbi:TraB/GumN family protein [Sphingomonas sp. LaA6.9]|uniref:TraB/GumN family protein n=1 Tax=Sphingomonas sp. LaA6.9 TaxID=2919914 RepID=UPI001F4FAE79|nr:TraB/GumN family protein [Sphingomonas sp. LaA6.9]MCJ8155921.1 TraB/GumN family protein [Sphingomonas sp. LaA6.9]